MSRALGGCRAARRARPRMPRLPAGLAPAVRLSRAARGRCTAAAAAHGTRCSARASSHPGPGPPPRRSRGSARARCAPRGPAEQGTGGRSGGGFRRRCAPGRDTAATAGRGSDDAPLQPPVHACLAAPVAEALPAVLSSPIHAPFQRLRHTICRRRATAQTRPCPAARARRRRRAAADRPGARASHAAGRLPPGVRAGLVGALVFRAAVVAAGTPQPSRCWRSVCPRRHHPPVPHPHGETPPGAWEACSRAFPLRQAPSVVIDLARLWSMQGLPWWLPLSRTALSGRAGYGLGRLLQIDDPGASPRMARGQYTAATEGRAAVAVHQQAARRPMTISA